MFVLPCSNITCSQLWVQSIYFSMRLSNFTTHSKVEDKTLLLWYYFRLFFSYRIYSRLISCLNHDFRKKNRFDILYLLSPFLLIQIKERFQNSTSTNSCDTHFCTSHKAMSWTYQCNGVLPRCAKGPREQQSTARAAEMSVTSNTRLISMACTFDFLQALFWESWQPFHCQFHLYQLFVHRSVKYYRENSKFRSSSKWTE